MQTKICTKCGIEKPIEDFFASKSGFLNKMAECKLCNCLVRYNRRRQKRIKEGKIVKIPTLLARQNSINGLRFCPACKQTKPLDQFYQSKNSNGGHASHCKDCSKFLQKKYSSKESQKKYYKRNKRKQLDIYLKREFGIGIEDYERMLDSQSGKCKICGKSIKENLKRLAVDHCHKTGKVRGLLCSSCNICIGFIEKNSLDISAIKKYLTQEA